VNLEHIVAIVWCAFMWFFVLYVNLSADQYEIHVIKLLMLERAAGLQGAWSTYRYTCSLAAIKMGPGMDGT
jgi:hypothetical protein